jgi:hypothetical protein
VWEEGVIRDRRLSVTEMQQLKSKLLEVKSKFSRSIRALEEASLRKIGMMVLARVVCEV